jgi:hypothetical protein
MPAQPSTVLLKRLKQAVLIHTGIKYLFKHLPEAMIEDEFEALLPHKVDKKLLDSPDA